MYEPQLRVDTVRFGLSEHDFLELVAFCAKAESEGFEYAAEEYRPHFDSAELNAWIGLSSDRLEALHDQHADAVAAFWDTPGADARYDAHLNAPHGEA